MKYYSTKSRSKVIYRLYCLINQETFGGAKIERDPLGKRYEVNRYCFQVSNVSNVKIKKIIEEVSHRLSGDLKKEHKDNYFIEGENIPNVSVIVDSSKNQTIYFIINAFGIS